MNQAVQMKREQFRVSIRRDALEKVFSKKRGNTIGMAEEFPQQQILETQAHQNIKENIDMLNNQITNQQNHQSIAKQLDILISLIPICLQHFIEYIETCSKYIVNITYFMNQQQIIQLIQHTDILIISNLLIQESQGLKDNYTLILFNLFCELSDQHSVQLAIQLNAISDICDACSTYGGNDDLYQKYLQIMIYLMNRNINISDISMVAHTIDDINKNTNNNHLKCYIYKAILSLFQLDSVDTDEIEQIFHSIQLPMDVVDTINTVNPDIQLTIYALMFINNCLDQTHIMTNTLVQSTPFIIALKNLLDKPTVYGDIKCLKLVYLVLYTLFSSQLEQSEQLGQLLEAIINHVQWIHKSDLTLPNTICKLLYILCKSNYLQTLILNVPIIKIINMKFEENEKPPMPFEMYLQTMNIVLNEGKALCADHVIGQFLQFYGCNILQLIQRDGDDLCYKAAQELLDLIET